MPATCDGGDNDGCDQHNEDDSRYIFHDASPRWKYRPDRKARKCAWKHAWQSAPRAYVSAIARWTFPTASKDHVTALLCLMQQWCRRRRAPCQTRWRLGVLWPLWSHLLSAATFSHGNQQRPLNLSRFLPLPREAKEDWAIEIVGYAQKNHTQSQNRRAACKRRRGKSRAHIRRPRRCSVAQSSNRAGGKSGHFCKTSWPRTHSFECHFEWKEAR